MFRTQRLVAVSCGAVLAVSAAGAIAADKAIAADRAAGRDTDDPRRAPGEGEGESAETALERLSERDYSTRQHATLQLWRERDASREAVQKAARHDDPEVAARAQWILRQWRRGVLPGTSRDVMRLLGQSESPSSIVRLLEAGRFAAAVAAVEELAGTAQRDAAQQHLAAALQRRFPLYAISAVERDALDDLLRLVDLVATTEALAMCRLELMRQMGIEVDSADVLPSAAETWTARERLRGTITALVLLGRTEEAIQRARSAGDAELLRRCRAWDGRWEAIADTAASQARQAKGGSLEEATGWSRALAAADRCEAVAIRREAVDHLTSKKAAAGTTALNIRWRSLALHGEFDAALEILHASSPDEAAVVAMAAARPERAFQWLRYPLAEMGQQLDGWIEHALQRQSASDENAPTEEVTRLLALMRCLLSVGRESEAWTIADRLSRTSVKVGRLGLREYVLSTLTVTSRKDWVAELAVQPGESSISTASQQSLGRTLPDADITALKILLEAFKELAPEASFRQRLSSVAELIRGEIPPGFDPETDFERLYQQLLQEGSGQFERVGGRMVFRPRMKLNLNIARLFLRHGQVELGQRCLEQLKMRGSMEAAFLLARAELETGRSETADEMFQEIWRRVDEKGKRLRGLAVGASDVEIAVKALAGSCSAAERRGDRERAEELRRRLRLVLCSPSTQLRNAVASHLAEQGEVELARTIYEALLPIAALGELSEFYDIAGDYATLMHDQGYAAEAARWLDLAVSETMASRSFPALAYVTLPKFVMRWALEAAIERGDADEAQQHTRRILALDPLDIDFAERLLPMMREAGMEQLADATLDRVLDRGLVHAESFPLDATTCNNLAWVAAINGRRLDDALMLSERAVWVEPESAIYRDTLAEILFRLGRRKEALRIEQACLLDDPSQWHLHEQIERFEEE